MDITNEWTNAAGTRGIVSERREYTVGSVTYTVDGKHIVLCPTEQERHIADLLAEKYGKQAELVPRIMYPQGVQTPDYLIDGERFDLKTLSGKGKNLLYGAIAKKRSQAHNFIVDVTHCPLPMSEIEKQVRNLFRSQRVGFLEKLVLVKNGKVIMACARK